MGVLQGLAEGERMSRFDQEVKLCKNIVKMAAAAARRALASLCVPFRGTTEIYGRQHIGSYMVVVDIFAETKFGSQTLPCRARI
jgi:hypothetical protein